MRTRKGRRTNRRPADLKARARGFDYGCLPYAMAVGASDFPALLTAASVSGVAYGSAWSDVLNRRLPTISLVARHGDQLAKAFDIFNAWSKSTDPDSVEMAFVFRQSGSYVLSLSTEFSRLERRCLGYDRAHKPMAFVAAWFKPVDSVHPQLRQFRERFSQPIAPFLLDGAVHSVPYSLLSASRPPDVRPVPGLQPLLKFEVTLVDERDVRPHTLAWLAAKAGSEARPESHHARPRPNPVDVARDRARILAYHFPVTLERMRQRSRIRDLMQSLGGNGIQPWQIEQALCNLVLSAELGRGPHFLGLSDRKATNTILTEIRQRYELANGDDLPTFAAGEVSTQILADGNALLRYLNKTPANDVVALQTALHSASALDGPTALERSTVT